MPYGVKRGVRAPGDFRLVDMSGLALASAAGILAALVTDYQQSGEASALYTINQWAVTVARMFNLGDVPLWAVVAGLVGIGAGSVFYLQPITRQGAFAQGFGLLAVLMTAVPADLAGGLESSGHDDLPGLEPIAVLREASYSPGGAVSAVYSAGEARLYEAQDRRSAAKYDVHITIDLPDGLRGDIDTMLRRGEIRGRLHNEGTGETYNIFRSAGGLLQRRGDTLLIDAGVPARTDTARLWVRIEIEGYAIEEQSAEASLGRSLDWSITMKPSGTPLFVQRFSKSYWF